jgi:hypothetical protein
MINSFFPKLENMGKRWMIFFSILSVSLVTRGQTQTFTGTGTFTVPGGVNSIVVECWGAGGAGGGTTANTQYGGGGGAGGSYAKKTISVVPGNTYTVTVGGIATGTTTAGANGNSSWFGTIGTVYAEGGAGGAAPNGGTAAGGTGSFTNNIGDIVYAGGNGADGNTTLSGGGGGGGGSTGSGGDASGTTAGTGTTLNGGNGGGGLTAGGDGNTGTNYGGGGSGAFVNNTTNRNGGNGAAGLVVISWSSEAFTSNGTFNVPAGVTSVNVETWGAGGGGSTRTSSGRGGGGGGGAYAGSVVAVTPGGPYNIGVGTGGAANTAGGNSTFNATTVIAAGGSGGINNSTTAGAGGTVAASTGTIRYAGGNGANGGATYSGGGGGGAGSAGAGGNAPAATGAFSGTGTSLNGGNGGVGINTNNNGNPGNTYGGGGGGATRTSGTRTGGTGANGYVIVSWTPPVFYSQGSGDPGTLSNWKTAGGYSPANFTANYQIFIIQNGHTMTTSGTGWTVSGKNTLVEIQSGGTLTETTDISFSSNTTLKIDNGGTLNHNVNSVTVFDGAESFGITSTVNYGFSGAQSVLNAIYGNLTLSGSGLKTIGSVTVNGIISMEGTATVSATPTYGTNATLQYKGSSAQLTGNEAPSVFNGTGGIIFNNAAGVTLTGNVAVSSIITMTQGNITTGSNTLTLSNSASGNLIYTNGILVGKFQRAIGLPTGTEYLYPVGTSTEYNPLKITFSNLTAGQLAVQFQPNDIGGTGLPLLNDAGADIYDRHTNGYWTLTAVAPMASTSYNVNLNYSGFTGVDALARILKRTDGGSLILNGTHGAVSSPEITRTGLSGISVTTTDLAIGKPNPRFTTQPSNTSGCNANFSVAVSGKATLTYKWQENNGGGFSDITNGGIYSGATGNSLTISGATGPMNGYLYRCVVTDGSGYTSTSTSAALTVSLPTVSLGYNYSSDITIDPASGSADLTDFPALISITASPDRDRLRTIANLGHVYSSNGYDIIFTDQSGNKLDHQIESYNAVTGQFIAWVRIPVLSNTASTTIKMLYGNSTVSSNPSVASVWTSNYKGVWHINGTDYTDATINANNGTENATTNVTGKIAGGRGFNGTTSYIMVPANGFVPNNNNQTISIWANYSTAPTGNRNLMSFQNAGAASAIQLGFRGGNAVAWKWGGAILVDGGASPSTNTWHYYAYTYDGTTSRLYIDGVEMDNSTIAPQTATPSEGDIGRYNPGEYIAASLDEPRFSMSPKSAGWILTEYNNQNDPANFISLGTEVITTLLTSLGVCSTTYTLNQGSPSGGSYSGTGVTGTNFNASAAGVGTHSITYLYTDVNGCSNSVSKNIIVTAGPAAPSASNKVCCVLNILDLEATGTNLKWYSDAALTILAGTGTPFATGKTTAGVYTYYVTQTNNGCESSATTVSLTVYNNITINTQPQPSLICEGENTAFTVDASGYNLTYQWQENSVNISNGPIFSGVTTTTLTLTNPGIVKNGNSYRCVVTSSCGTPPLNSNAAVLTVTALPVATFSYTGTPYCPNAANPTPTFSGGGVAGTFSSTTGLVFISTATGQINIAASTPGSYTVTNTIAASGGCGIVTATSPITIISDIIWTGLAGTDWNDTGNWSCAFIPTSFTNVQIQNVANKPVLGTGAFGTVNNIIIDNGASLTITGNTIQISGTITNNGTFNSTNGIVEVKGSGAQVIGANIFTGNTIKDLIVDNSAGVTLQGALNITGTVKVLNGNLISGGNLSLISTASGTALIDGSGSGQVLGNVIMQRYLPSGYGYKYFSSPFQAATVNGFADDINLASPTTLFYRYDESRTASGWVNYKNIANVLNPMQGYAVNLGSSAAANTIDITGVVNNGNMSVTLYNHNNTYTKGFNLVGNPYPSPINWDAASGWTKTNIDNAVYYFKASATDQYGGTYSTYINGISSDGSATNIVPSMQGFFVHVSDGGWPVTGTLGFSNSVRMTDQTHPFLKSGKMRAASLLRITATFSDDINSSDPVVIYFNDKADEAFDSELDALKILNTDLKVPNLYTVTPEGAKLSICALPNTTDTVEIVPLGLKLNKSGNVIFRIRDFDETMISVKRIYLTDIVAGTEQDLLPDMEYNLFLTTGEYQNRFFLNMIKNIKIPDTTDTIVTTDTTDTTDTTTGTMIPDTTTSSTTSDTTTTGTTTTETDDATDTTTVTATETTTSSDSTGIIPVEQDYVRGFDLFSIYSSYGILKAQINSLPGENGNLMIYNIIGQIVFKVEVYEPGYYEFNPMIKEGIYIVNYTSAKKRSSKKIFIQHR